MKDEWWIDRAEQIGELLLAVSAPRPWTLNDTRQALKCALELEIIGSLLTLRMEGRRPGWCSPMDAWVGVINGSRLIAADLLYDMPRDSQRGFAATAKRIRWVAHRTETAVRRPRKRMASGISSTVRAGYRGVASG